MPDTNLNEKKENTFRTWSKYGALRLLLRMHLLKYPEKVASLLLYELIFLKQFLLTKSEIDINGHFESSKIGIYLI